MSLVDPGAAGATLAPQPPSRWWRFSLEALVWAVLLFGVEVLIATLGAPYPWLRGFVGDLLAVVWVYFVFRTVLAFPACLLALAALAVGCTVELGQYLAAANGWKLTSPVLRTLLGSVPDWWDVLAYAAGFVLIMTGRVMRRR